MGPIEFKEQNLILTKPQSMTDKECQSLPVLRLETGQIVSCWKLSEKDLKKINTTGVVWLSVWSGRSAPPVAVTVDQPFIMELQSGEKKNGANRS